MLEKRASFLKTFTNHLSLFMLYIVECLMFKPMLSFYRESSIGYSNRTSIAVPKETVEISPLVTRMKAVVTDSVVTSSTVLDLAGLSEPVPQFLVQKVRASILFLMAQVNFKRILLSLH